MNYEQARRVVLKSAGAKLSNLDRAKLKRYINPKLGLATNTMEDLRVWMKKGQMPQPGMLTRAFNALDDVTDFLGKPYYGTPLMKEVVEAKKYIWTILNVLSRARTDKRMHRVMYSASRKASSHIFRAMRILG